MASKTRAVLKTQNATVITGQTAPDSITPTTSGNHVDDIIDSMLTLKDPIPVGTLAPDVSNPLNIPACFIGVITSGESLKSIIEKLMVAICNIDPNSDVMDLTIFRAEKTTDQPVAAVTGNTTIYFEDDTTSPNYDNGNRFFVDRYVSPGVITKTFCVEKLVLTGTQGNPDSYRLAIFKNGVEIATSPTYGVGATTMTDVYGNDMSGTGFMFPPVVAEDIALVQGDDITAAIVHVHNNSSNVVIKAGGIFSNS